MTEEEYNNKLQLYRERIKLLGELLDKACNSSVKDINECDRLSNQLLAVKKLEEELVKNRANVVASRNEKNEELKNDSQNKTEPSEDSQKKINNEENINNEIKNAGENKKLYEQNKKASQQERRQMLSDCTPKVPNGNTVVPVPPISSEECKKYMSKTENRLKKVMNVCLKFSKEIYNRIFAVRTNEGGYYELNAAATPDVDLYDGDELVANINSYKILPHDTEEKIEAKRIGETVHYSDGFIDITYKMKMVILHTLL